MNSELIRTLVGTRVRSMVEEEIVDALRDETELRMMVRRVLTAPSGTTRLNQILERLVESVVEKIIEEQKK